MAGARRAPVHLGEVRLEHVRLRVRRARRGRSAGRNDKGLVTYDRATKKDAFYFYKAAWSDEPVVHIAARRFTPRTTAATTVKVYSNARPSRCASTAFRWAP